MLSMIASKAGVMLLIIEVYLDPWSLYWANLKKKSLHVLKKIEAMHPPANSLDFVATSVSLSWYPPSRNQNDISYLKQADFNTKQFSSTLTFSSTISPLAKGANVKPGIPKWSELMHIAAGFGYQLLIWGQYLSNKYIRPFSIWATALREIFSFACLHFCFCFFFAFCFENLSNTCITFSLPHLHISIFLFDSTEREVFAQ